MIRVRGVRIDPPANLPRASAAAASLVSPIVGGVLGPRSLGVTFCGGGAPRRVAFKSWEAGNRHTIF